MTAQLLLTASSPPLLLPECCLSLSLPLPEKRKRKPREKSNVIQEPRKFNGHIKLYWQEFGEKPDVIVEIHNPEHYAMFEILHGLYELEGIAKWSNRDDWESLYNDIFEKCSIYADRIKRVKRLHVDKWDWDWAD